MTVKDQWIKLINFYAKIIYNLFLQSAVRAAVNGRILIIEGIEKAERNVLPVLNNLLENREMNLEDGRLLIPAARYDDLLKVSILICIIGKNYFNIFYDI